MFSNKMNKFELFLIDSLTWYSHPKCTLVFKKVKCGLKTIQKTRLQQNAAQKKREKTSCTSKLEVKCADSVGKKKKKAKKTKRSVLSSNIENEGAMGETPADLVHLENIFDAVNEPQLAFAVDADQVLSFDTLDTTFDDAFLSSLFDLAQRKDIWPYNQFKSLPRISWL